MIAVGWMDVGGFGPVMLESLLELDCRVDPLVEVRFEFDDWPEAGGRRPGRLRG